ncbi:conjugal transfer protein [Vibrio parahaemolyticus]|uniref:conjugal transfer protein n=1 Tax=Vibrio parahaemolyticus TaxID=670 RepID=UPI000AEA5CAF|nr:conjugal transfer protein [Vibrio parahaemolyticus]HDM8234320.1 conjugal transfer protein [Vibrio campbellii]MBE4171681.1 conjugal transfer protein [Vibrio parahaemolyticus]MCI9700461.1 conjugal transfer protein [Vibrio parahaemolyticus]MCR9709980.1 conjugal transfer protein [Vibrio parahaemolyticus]MCR9756615.1 conjugal transfer protein [Vibrio parahaemolyticus]
MKALHSNTQAYSNLKAAFIAMMLALVCHPAIAAGGLDEATNWVDEIADWAYKLLGSAVFVYSIVMVILALIEKKTWGDVGISIAKAAGAGGIVAAVTYAWSIWGS